ncbi:AsmA family protein [Adhaeribacter pallidiroseus]|uniref:AsmA family protein n=1 Tax=Adhaeribacter pallidiroseus TaxID=2072847 RepID=UPI00131451EC|nr:AsmA-like C-terminal region-containing protein [Adhaeribacter pallidiroseus]
MKKIAFSQGLRYGVGGLLLLLLLGAGVLYSYQDKIINLFVAEANQHLKTKVQVGHISLSLLRKFPDLAITLKNVTITESFTNSKAPLAQAEQLYFTFNVWDVLRGQYRVQEMFLEEGNVAIKFLPDGTGNYQVFTPDTTQTQNKPFAFELKKITVRNVALTYADQRRQQYFNLKNQQVQATLQVSNKTIEVAATGQTHLQTIRIEGDDYFQDKQVGVQTKLVVDRVNRTVQISSGEVAVGPARYQVAGNVSYAGPTNLNIRFAGKNTNVQSLLALLPPKFSRVLGEYQSEGRIYFNGTVQGITSGKANPRVLVRFGCRQATFYHPASQQKLEDLNLQGEFSNGPQQNNQTSTIQLNNIRGKLKNRPFTGGVLYRNLQDPFLQVKLKGTLDVAHALELFPNDNLSRGGGEVTVDIALAGKLQAFQSQQGYGQVSSSGEINLKNAAFQVKNYPLRFRQLHGNFIFRKSDLAVSDFTGKLGSSDFLINGYFKNVLGWLFLTKQRLLVEADFTSRFLNFDELLREDKPIRSTTISNKRPGANPAYQLAISPYLGFDVKTTVDRVQFRRFTGKNLTGILRLNNRVISSPGLALQTTGGQFAIQGLLDGRQPNNLQVTTLTTVNQLKLDSLFYVFENFGQQFLVQRHLRGTLTATVHSDLYFNRHLNPLTDRMEAEIKARIQNGQLINFEPMQKLAPFIPKRELANLQFSELSNTFWIQDRTVFIPEMEVRSNASRVSVIGVQGTHTFDQQLDYRFRVPLRNKNARVTDETGNLLVSNGPNIFLRLKGSENNYKIALDKQRVKTKIAQDLQREKQEYKEVRQPDKKGTSPKTSAPQPNQDEYFDF